MESMQDLFMRLVRIGSESGSEDLLMQELKQILSEELGARCQFDSFGNLVARLDAKRSEKEISVLLGAHADTVRPGNGIVPILRAGVISSSGDTILGADDKAGLVEIIEALKTAPRHPPVEVLITRSEEVGLLGAKNLDISLLRSEMGFVLDASDLNSIVIGGPTHINLDIEIQGKAAHAGLRPEQGISAIRTAAKAILNLQEGRIDAETTANVGIVEGGQARNSVSARARIQAECRSLNHDKALSQCAMMEHAFREAGHETGATVRIESTVEYEASRVDSDHIVVRTAAQALARAGLTPDVRVSAGGTDAIVLTAKGIPSVVLGFGGKQAHSLDEHIAVADMECAARIVRNVLCLLS